MTETCRHLPVPPGEQAQPEPSETPEEQPRNIVEHDGLLVDEDTGEVVGTVRPEFRVTDEGSASWVLAKMQDAHAHNRCFGAAQERAIAAYETRLLELEQEDPILRVAVLQRANAEAGRERAVKRLQGLTARFGAELRAWAQSVTTPSNRTARLIEGALSLRSSRASVGLRGPDEETFTAADMLMLPPSLGSALFAVAEAFPEAVRVSVRLMRSELPKGVTSVEALVGAAAQAGRDPLTLQLLRASTWDVPMSDTLVADFGDGVKVEIAKADPLPPPPPIEEVVILTGAEALAPIAAPDGGVLVQDGGKEDAPTD